MATLTNHPPFTRKPDLDPEQLAKWRGRFEAGEASYADLAAEAGRGVTTLRAIGAQQGWVRPGAKPKPVLKRKTAAKQKTKAGAAPKPKTKTQVKSKPKPKAPAKLIARAPPRPAKTKAAAPAPASREPLDPRHLMQRLAGRALDLMDMLERKLGGADAGESDARLMASLIKMLGDFRRFGFDGGDNEGSGAAHGHAGASPAETAGDLARLRTSVVEKLTRPGWPGADHETGAEADAA